MQSNIQHLRQLFLIGLVLLILMLVYWQLIQADTLTARNDNPRPVVAEQRIQRGAILTEDGALLVETILDSNGLPQRRYSDSAIAPVVGYSSLRYGTGGLEAAYDATLRGDADVTWLSTLMHQPQIGNPITVTLYLPAQRAAAAALAEQGTTGAVIVMNAETGAIRVMASHPTFDPNLLESDWDALTEDPAAPLLNRATQGLFPLGDLARLIILVQLAETGIPLPDAPLTIPLDNLLALTTPSEILSTVQQLGFDQAPSFTLPTASGVVPDKLPADLAETSVTPLHLVLLGTAIVDKSGVASESYLVTDQPRLSPLRLGLISPKTATALRTLQPEFTASVPPQITGNEYLSWYLAYTNTSPTHVIIAAVTTPNEDPGAASSVAQTVLKALFP